MLLAVNHIIWVILPILSLQYALALFCLTKLAYLKLSVKMYVIWNIFILLAFFVGSFVFLIYYYKNKSRLAIVPEIRDDKIVIDDKVTLDNNVETLSEEQNIDNGTLSEEQNIDNGTLDVVDKKILNGEQNKDNDSKLT